MSHQGTSSIANKHGTCIHTSLVIRVSLTNNNFSAQNKNLQVSTYSHLRSSSLLAMDILACRFFLLAKCNVNIMILTGSALYCRVWLLPWGTLPTGVCLASWFSYMRKCLQP